MEYVSTELIEKLRGLYKTFSRKKVVNITQDNALARVLSTVDLIALGVGSTLQYYAYFMMTFKIKDGALSITISMTIAAIISMITGLCYAELSARMPRAGSAYIYSYVTMGEFVAFFTGWTMILKYMLDSAVTVRILSYYVDTIFSDNSIEDFFEAVIPIKNLLSYTDILAFGLTLIFSAVLALGTKTSCVLNNILILLKLSINIIIILIISSKVVSSSSESLKKAPHTNFSNETITLANDPYDTHMITRIIDSAILFSLTFIGFDCVTTMGEETKNPQQSIPRAIITSITTVFFVYFGLFVALISFLHYKPDFLVFLFLVTLMNNWVRCILTIEIISGFSTSLLGSMLSLPRVIYAMSSDGLIFKSLSHVNPRFQTRIKGILITWLRSGIPAMIFDTESLNNVRHVCAMVLYLMVALCIIILRYEENKSYRRQDESSDNPQTFIFIMKQLVNAKKLKHPTKLTAQIVNVFLCCYVILCICTVSLLPVSEFVLNFEEGSAINIMLIILTIALVIILCFIHFQPISDKKLTFTVPLVPFLPGFSIFLNIYIIKIYYSLIWIGFSLWMVIGLGVYFLYGIWHSNIRQRKPPSESNNDDKDDGTAL